MSSLRENTRAVQAEPHEHEEHEQMSVGFQLFSLNLSRVLLIAIFLLITIPIFTSETYFKMLTSYQSGLICLGELVNKQGGITGEFDDLMAYYRDSFDREAGGNRKIIYLKVVQVASTITNIDDFETANSTLIKEYGVEADLEDHRPYTIKSFSSLTSYENIPKDTFYLVVFINNNYDENIDAVLGIFRTIFVLLVFGMLTYFFRRDTFKLLVQPLGKMKRTIRLVKKYPIQATNYIDLEFLTEYFDIQTNYLKKITYEEQQRYETAALVNMLTKSSELLSIGLGEAGQQILKNHLKDDKVNLLGKGIKVYCIFGFCNIRRFEEINNQLKSSILEFVNKIAEIVHENVHKHLGATNKNIGDVFLLVWKFKNSELIYQNSSKELAKFMNDESEDEEEINNMIDEDDWVPVLNPRSRIAKRKCDLALMSFVKIFLTIQTDQELKLYCQSHLEGIKVDMGFGLYCGWSIEGAIGSEHKIDAR